MEFIEKYLSEAIQILETLDRAAIAQAIGLLKALRDRGGRLFILGVGGSAANASHAVNDFRKLAGIEAYAPTDNVSELTARTNDEGWDTTYSAWLAASRLRSDDALMVFSVGGGNAQRNISVNLVRAMQYARDIGAQILGVAGRDGGFLKEVGDVCVLIPTVNPANVTPHTEAFQAVVWHLFVSHPEMQMRPTKWESAAGNL